MKKMTFAAALVLPLAGCGAAGISAKNDARTTYQQSVENYRSCVVNNPNNLKACETQRVLMETDERTFNNLSAGVSAGNNVDHVIVQSR